VGRQGLIGALRARVRTSARPAVEVPHRINLGEHMVELVLRQSARRSFALMVDHRGARVAVPHGTPLRDVDRFILAHGPWLLARLSRREARAVPLPFVIADGASLPLLGRTARIRTGGAGRVAHWRLGGDGAEELWLPGAGTASGLLRALRGRALDWFGGRVEEYCHRLHLPVPAVRLSSARTRWGSCSQRSGIRLHWRLIHLEPALIDYVVAHEVAHLLEMNHSPRFWSVVARVYPEWQSARRRLREQGAVLPVIDVRDRNPIGQED
jgi:predicted metal-dependent hydrolase